MTSPQDGYITTEELVAFFGETSKGADAERNAKYWLQEIDGYGENDGYITLVLRHIRDMRQRSRCRHPHLTFSSFNSRKKC